ncbi:MAG: hypothetical protein HZA36_01015 [Parcubacteria group bacterium]|nr:hypothetical protein [Parcubacteria group bacterium]
MDESSIVNTKDASRENNKPPTQEKKEGLKTIEKIKEQGADKRGRLAQKMFISNGLDMTPVAGSLKTFYEAGVGKTLLGEELLGKERVVHAALGVAILATDLMGGEILRLGGKAIPLVAKIGEGLAARGLIRAAAIFQATLQFMTKHPDLVAKAEQYAEKKMMGGFKKHASTYNIKTKL